MHDLPDHLGGHANRTYLDPGALTFFQREIGVRSMLDIGCATGGMVRLAQSMGMRSHGIDGDWTLDWNDSSSFSCHDFSRGTFRPRDHYDLVWCCSFLEHLAQEFLPNIRDCVLSGRWLVTTWCDRQGHHHVNNQPADYWIRHFDHWGLEYRSDITQRLRAATTLKMAKGQVSAKSWIYHYGLVFENLEHAALDLS